MTSSDRYEELLKLLESNGPHNSAESTTDESGSSNSDKVARLRNSDEIPGRIVLYNMVGYEFDYNTKKNHESDQYDQEQPEESE